MSAQQTDDSPFIPGDTYQGMPVVRTMSVTERAAQALSKAEAEAEIKALVEQSKPIVAVTDPASRAVCHDSLMTLKNMRVLIEKRGKAGREEAVTYSKAVIAIEKELVSLITPEETRLAGLRDEWDSLKEREKEAAIQREIDRVAEIQRRIDGIRNWPINAANQPSMLVGQMLASAQAYRIEPEVFEEHAEAATAVLAASTAALAGILQQRKDAEAEQDRIKAEREELAKLRAEQAERDRLAAEARAKQEAEDKTKRDAEAAATAEANRKERERIAKEEAEAKAKRARTAAIRERIDELRGNQMLTATSGSDLIAQHFSDLEKLPVNETFEEFEEEARKTKEAGLLRLHALYDAALEHETEQARLATERAENERQAAARQAELDAQAEAQRQANAAEERRLADQRVEIARQTEALRKAQEPTVILENKVTGETVSVASEPTLEKDGEFPGDEPSVIAGPGDYWSVDGESYIYGSLAELLESNEDIEAGTEVHFGTAVTPDPAMWVDADDVIDQIACSANDECGEWAEDYPDVTAEAKDELNTLLQAWARKHCMPTFWSIRDSKSYTVTAADIAETHGEIA
jgi:hypothetical protein